MLVTRREFVGGVAATWLFKSASVVDAAPDNRRFPLGFSLYGAPGVAPAVALPAIHKIGYDCVELSCLPTSPTHPQTLSSAASRQELRTLLADNGLKLSSLMENLTEPSDDAAHRANLQRLQAACDLGQALSPDAPPVVETILGHKPAQWETVKQGMADRLRAWAALAERIRTVIAIKPHVGNAMHLPEHALWILEQVQSPWIKLTYDYSHYALRGLAMDDTIAAIGPRAAFCHVKDARGMAEKFEFLLPGETGLDYVRLFRKLHASGYCGAIVVEVSSQISRRPDYDWLTAARRSYENLAPAMATAAET